METILNNVLTAGFYGGIMLLAVLLLRLFLRKTQRSLICALWVLAFLRLLIPVNLESRFSLQPVSVPVLREEVLSEAMERKPVEGAESPAVPEAAEPREKEISWLPIVWLGGVGAVLGYGLLSDLRLSRRLREAVKDGDYYVSDQIETAFLFGFLRPRIYIPARTNREDLPYILAHERAHLRRGDPWWKCLGYLALAIHWFDPLVWLAWALYCRDTELACDKRVVKTMSLTERKQYSEALVRASAPGTLGAMTPLAFGEVGVKERILSVLNYKKPAFWVSALGIVLVILAAVGLMTVPKTSEAPSGSEDSFLSHDGLVTYTWNLKEPVTVTKAPHLEVVPHDYTPEDVETLRKVFYGDAPLYAVNGEDPRQLTKQELRRREAFLEQFQDPEAFRGLMSLDDPDLQPDQVPNVLQKLEKQIPTAPETVQESLWDGSFKTDGELTFRGFGYLGENPYELRLTKVREEDYQTRDLYFGLSDCGEEDLVSFLGHAQRHAKGPATQEMGEQLAAQARKLLDALAPDAWQIRRVRIRTERQQAYSNVSDLELGEAASHYVNVDLVPSFGGVPGLDFPIGGLYESDCWDRDVDCTPVYDSPQGYVTYNSEGLMDAFTLHNPVDVVAELAESPTLLTPEQLMEKAQDWFSDFGQEKMESFTGEEGVTFRVEITDWDFGMVILPLEGTPGHFQAVPAITFRGPVNVIDGDEDLGNFNYNQNTLVTVNALDGSIIG